MPSKTSLILSSAEAKAAARVEGPT